MNRKNEELKQARINCQLTQVEVAQRAQIAERLYQDYEYNKREPGVRTAIRIAEVLEVKKYEDFKRMFGAATPDITKEPDGNPAK